jgi:hypothetical protein
MIKRICLDTGPITLYFSKNCSDQIITLFQFIETQQYHAQIIPPVLVEVYKHLSDAGGKSLAESSITKLFTLPCIELVEIEKSTLIKAGQLKVEYPSKLSVVDCLICAYSILKRVELHTTEKELPDIQNLKVIKYYF